SKSSGTTLTETQVDTQNAAVLTYTSAYDVTTGVQHLTFTEKVDSTTTDPTFGCISTFKQDTNISGTLNWQINPPPPTCDVTSQITLLKQGPPVLFGGPIWADDTYDESDFTISQKGCALTSLAMACQFAGFTISPRQLNTSLVAYK